MSASRRAHFVRCAAVVAMAATGPVVVSAQTGGGAVQPGAQAGQLPSLPVTELDQRDVSLDSPRRLTLTFAEPRPIHEVLQLLVRGTPFSLQVEPNADGVFTGELKQLTLREALTTLLTPLGLDFSVQGTVISVFRRRTETRAFDLDLVAVKRGWDRTVGPGGTGGDGTLTASAAPDDPFDGITAGIKTLLSESGVMHVDRRAGLAEVTDYPDRLDRVGSYLEALHVRRTREVHLEGRVLEVALTDHAAIDWGAVRERLGLARASIDAGLGADLSAVQTALAAQGNIRVLSAPDMLAMNNEPAIVRGGSPDASLITLTVIPQISADGVIQLSLSPAWDAHVTTGVDGQDARVTDADTMARVRDGSTVVVSGFLRSQDVTAKATGLSALFSVRQRKTARVELVVLLRATIVAPRALRSGSRP
jgi:type II secretory pathway component HofQ